MTHPGPSQPHVAALWCYPVKGLAPVSLTRAQLTAGGIDGDRAEALFVTSDGHARTGKTYRGKEDRLLHTFEDVGAAQTLGQLRGITLEARNDGAYFDAEPLSLIADAWIREAEALAGRALDVLRFRPNVYVEGWDPGPEAELVGRVVRIGDAVVEIVAPIERCVTIGYDVATAENDEGVLRAIAQQRENTMGVYARVRTPGTLVVGAPIVTE